MLDPGRSIQVRKKMIISQRVDLQNDLAGMVPAEQKLGVWFPGQQKLEYEVSSKNRRAKAE